MKFGLVAAAWATAATGYVCAKWAAAENLPHPKLALRAVLGSSPIACDISGVTKLLRRR
jgi:hypothetical protein